MYYLCTGNKEACKGERTRFMYLEELFSGKKKKSESHQILYK